MSLWRRSVLTVAMGLAGAVATGVITSPAAANGYCGNNPDGPHSCGIASGGSYSGALSTTNEADFYRFATPVANTQVHVAVTDIENPACEQAPYPTNCGSAWVQLLDSVGNDIQESTTSTPRNGIQAPGTLDYTVPEAGTYYLVIKGNLGTDANGNNAATPYVFGFTSSSPTPNGPPPANNPPATTPTTPPARSARCHNAISRHNATLSRLRRDQRNHRSAKVIRRDKEANLRTQASVRRWCT